MHELSIVFYIIRAVEKVCEEQNLTNVACVVLDMGEVSTVVESYLLDAWKWAVKKKSTRLQDSTLKINRITAITHCNTCGANYLTTLFAKTCPLCHSEDTYLIQGSEFIIREIVAE